MDVWALVSYSNIMVEKKRCGPQTELSTNAAAKITRCGCGTIHLHIVRSGITLQLSTEHFAELSATVAGAHDALKMFEGVSSEDNPTIN